MAERFSRSVTMTLGDLYALARNNTGFEAIEQGIIDHPEWLTEIPSGRTWGILHQVVYHGNVDQLNRLLVIQIQNPKFRLLSETSDKKTVLNIAREERRKHEAMYQRIENLAIMDELVNNARNRNWEECKKTLNKNPGIVNEKPPYRRFYFVHHIAYVGDRKAFDDFDKQYPLDLSLLTSEDKSVGDVAKAEGHQDFADYVDDLKRKQQEPKETSKRFSRESRIAERAHAADIITGSASNERGITPVQNNNTATASAISESSLIESLTCPLSGKLLKIPVVAADGITYEKENIVEHLKTHDKSPVTNEVFKDKELKPNLTIESILKKLTLQSSSTMSPTATSTYYKVQTGDTLTGIAEKKGFRLDQMQAANPELKDFDQLRPNQIIKLPLVQQLIDSTTKKEGPVSNDSVTVFQHFDKENVEPSLIPANAPSQNLAAAKQKLHAVFLQNDVNGDGFLSLEEFKVYLSKLNLKMEETEVSALFKEIDRENRQKLTFQGFSKFYEDMIKGESAEHSQSEIDLLTAFLKADMNGTCELGGISQFINQRWKKFNNFKRDGKTGKLVMVGGAEAVDVLPGEYSLVDLITWSEIEPQGAEPKHVKILNVRWTSNTDSKPGSGCLVFPNSFDTLLPIETATNDKLAYYGCCLANESHLKVSLLHRHAIQDFTYSDNYFRDFVRGRAGVERHEFAHLDCPFQEDSGFFILGKFFGRSDNELHLTAFKIPTKHTLYVPPRTIHSNDYLKGTWRTMLSDATLIDHAILEKQRYDGEREKFCFDFQQ